MAKVKKTPVQEKQALLDELKKIKDKIAHHDEKQALKLAKKGKQFGLTNLADDIIEKEFLAIKEKYKDLITPTLSHLSSGKKNS